MRREHQLLLLLVSAISAAGMWIYTQRVLIAYQVSDASAHERPRGNLSDLYPRWLGTQELLLHGRDPYSREVTMEIQTGYYGRPLDPARSGDPKDQQAFAYPLYVVFLLAPLVHLPFSHVQKASFWFLFALTAATIPLWLRFLRVRLRIWLQLAILGLLLGSFAVMQGLMLQQMTLLVAGLAAAGLAFLVSDYPIPAGICLALATIKPQLVLLLLCWFAIWSMADVRKRSHLGISFLATMAVLVGGSLWYMPDWISKFWSALVAYQAYTRATSALEQLVWPPMAFILEALALIVCARFCWKYRGASETTDAFAICTCLVLTVTVFVVPTYAPYNQILLLPVIILLWRNRHVILEAGTAGRFLWAVSLAVVAWQWFAAALVALGSFVLPAHIVLRAWPVPGWTILFIPVATAALMLIYTHRTAVTAQIAPPTA